VKGELCLDDGNETVSTSEGRTIRGVSGLQRLSRSVRLAAGGKKAQADAPTSEPSGESRLRIFCLEDHERPWPSIPWCS